MVQQMATASEADLLIISRFSAAAGITYRSDINSTHALSPLQQTAKSAYHLHNNIYLQQQQQWQKLHIFEE